MIHSYAHTELLPMEFLSIIQGESDGGDGTNDGQNQCPHCLRFYETKQKLKTHIQKYCLKEKKYKCFYCAYRSKRRDHIRRHMYRVHSSQLKRRLNLGLSMDIEATQDDEGTVLLPSSAAADIDFDSIHLPSSNSSWQTTLHLQLQDN